MNLYEIFRRWEMQQERIREERRKIGDLKMQRRALRMGIKWERGVNGWRSRRQRRFDRQVAREMQAALDKDRREQVQKEVCRREQVQQEVCVLL